MAMGLLSTDPPKEKRCGPHAGLNQVGNLGAQLPDSAWLASAAQRREAPPIGRGGDEAEEGESLN